MLNLSLKSVSLVCRVSVNLVTSGGTLASAGREGVKFGCYAASGAALRKAGSADGEEVHYGMLSSGFWLAAKRTCVHTHSAEGIPIFPAARRLVLLLFLLLLGLLSESLSFCYVSSSAVSQT